MEVCNLFQKVKKAVKSLIQRHRASISADEDLRLKSKVELLSLMRHEAHRIEKAFYNGLLDGKLGFYQEKHRRLGHILHLLADLGSSRDEPTVEWATEIYNAFDHIEQDFVEKHSLRAHAMDLETGECLMSLLKQRRSVRVWADKQPDEEILQEVAIKMIDAARWAPSSGNRQPWRFLTLTNQSDRSILQGVKERHCTSAPLLIFVGIDTRAYGSPNTMEPLAYIDAGAAIMQMLLVAHQCGLGACWNHLSDDLINSRQSNIQTYARFATKFGIPKCVSPVAVISVGQPKFLPPAPARTHIADLLL